MKAERWKEIDNLFHAALEREPAERAAFVAVACGGDQTLREEVESLLASHNQAASFIESPPADLAADLIADNQIRLVAGHAVGPYKIVTLLGTGGMGEVYLAQDLRLSRRVALKLLPAEFTEDEDRIHRFEREARAASSLNHPNIVTIHEIGKLDGTHFIITEYIEGHTLRQQMTGAKMRLRQALEVAIQVANALGAAHKAGIVHRDIKPENIMVRPDGLVKVLDFGLAKLAEPPPTVTDDEASTVVRVKTASGFVMGTVSYMSPEQARGQAVDARTDIFSLGVVLYEMIAGRAPFEGATTSDMIAAILREEPAPLRHRSREAPAQLDWVAQKALAKDREERYQTIKELQIDLKRLSQELERKAKLEIASARSHDRATKSTDKTTDEMMGSRATLSSDAGVASADSGGGSVVGESKPEKRSVAISFRSLVVAFAILAIFTVVSFYAGLKQTPLPSQPAQPTFRQLTFRRGTISSARFARDGQTVVYSAAFDGKPVELFTRRLESPESSSLNRQAGIQAISPTGEIAILLDCGLDWGECHDGTLARMPLVGGTPREILDNVYEADWSPDGDQLAIVRVVERAFQLEYPIGTVLYKSTGRIRHPHVSPKGDMVAFIDNPILSEISGAIMVVDRAGQTKVLSEGWKSVVGLVWSPTGDEVWYSASKYRGQSLYAVTLGGQQRLVHQGASDLRLLDISRDGRILLTYGMARSRMIGFSTGAEHERDLSWFDWSTSADISADGKSLLFYEWGRALDGIPYVYLRKLDGLSDPKRLGQGKALALSPDGKWAIALQEGPPPQLVLLPTGAGEQRVMPRGEIVEYHYASWFPDGQQILFTGLPCQGCGPRSYVQDVSTGQMHPITGEDVIALMVSPDGKQLLTWAPDGDPDGRYYLSPMDGTRPTPIPGLGPGEMPIQWSADGRAIYVRGSSDFDSNIYRIDLSGRRRELWKEIVPDPFGLIGVEVKPGGVKITPDGKSYIYTYWTSIQDLFLVEGLK
jgi:eukaryotic-like serine/threonine-protein kinase